jgi:hypothetical protein
MKIKSLTIGRGCMSVQAIRCSKTASGVHPTDMVSVRLKAVFNQTSEILLNMLVHRHFLLSKKVSEYPFLASRSDSVAKCSTDHAASDTPNTIPFRKGL